MAKEKYLVKSLPKAEVSTIGHGYHTNGQSFFVSNSRNGHYEPGKEVKAQTQMPDAQDTTNTIAEPKK